MAGEMDLKVLVDVEGCANLAVAGLEPQTDRAMRNLVLWARCWRCVGRARNHTLLDVKK